MSTDPESPNLLYVVTHLTPIGESKRVYPVGFTPIIPRVGEKISGKEGVMEVIDVIHEMGILEGSDTVITNITLKLKRS